MDASEAEIGWPEVKAVDDTQGLEDISFTDDNVDDQNNEKSEVPGCIFDDESAVNGLDDLYKINLKDMNAEDVMRFHFPDLGVAFMFYNWYGAVHGFSGRKSKIFWNKNGDAIQQTFLCYREGQRVEREGSSRKRKREPKANVRCGCMAKCRVHVESKSGRWYIKYISDVHNHTMMDEKYTGMLPAHRRINEYDKYQMTCMRSVGISTPCIYGVLANQAGGYVNVGFRKRDLYNEQMKDRRAFFSDAKAAFEYLQSVCSADRLFFWRHTVNEEGRLQNLFWCDGSSRADYSVFGDVVAFDATYKKNKYMCPLVVFSGVNHHNQSVVFASALVGNETEETYVWVLDKFVEAMGGKVPTSVITDGDIAMRNAIKRVFPTAHHRLCAWHLLRNATSNVKNPKFVSKFKQCMLGDYDVCEFERKWKLMVVEFGLVENNWIKDLYEKRNMWATSHIRGKFFAGFRTTSRCEGLHSEFGKYVNFQNNLHDFLQRYLRWLNYMRYREVEADFTSAHGQPVYQTQYQLLEMSAAKLYTRAVFLLFRPVLERACTCRVVKVRRVNDCYTYTVTRYRKDGLLWNVSFFATDLKFKCSCERLESLGIPCEHLVSVMVFLDIVHMPECLVLTRWTKIAKDFVGASTDNTWANDPTLLCQYVAVVERGKRLAKAAVFCRMPQHLRDTIEIMSKRTEFLESLVMGGTANTSQPDNFPDDILNPARARNKGCGSQASTATNKTKRKGKARKAPTCFVCKGVGHNRKSCPIQRKTGGMTTMEMVSDVAHQGNDTEELQEEPTQFENEVADYNNIDMSAV